MEKKRMILFAMLALAFTGMVFTAGYSAATTLTQKQVDLLKTEEVIANLDISLDSIMVDEDMVYLILSYNSISKEEGEKDYVVKRANASVAVGREWLNSCISSKGLAICKKEYLEPELLAEAKRMAARETANVESIKTKTDLFTVEDLVNIVDKNKLNDKNLLAATIGAG